MIFALLGRMRKARVALPGGCNFGLRPIDQHLKGFRALGAKIDDCAEETGAIYAETDGLIGTNIYLDVVSVGATINVILAATLAKGVTIIENVAKEPHIVDVANFLNAMGAKIKGAGTDVITITGVTSLNSGATYSIVPDQIEAGTFMIAAAAAGGNVLVKNVIPKHMESLSSKLEEMGVTVEHLKEKCADLHEFNPMMGHRGCRLAVTYPEIARMQTRALMEAAIEVKEEEGYDIIPEIMIPLVGEIKELKFVKEVVVETAELVKKEKNSDMEYHIGTMIEIPRAALTADEIAKEAEFFSFGTNDLTQMTFGFSRDDAGKFLPAYYANKIYESDPFARLDTTGVGKLMKMAVDGGKAVRPNMHLGICGEHGGDPSSIEFCHEIGLSYVSCSPYRVPIARLAAAQANIKKPRN